MTAKEYLNKLLKIEADIQSRQNELLRVREELLSIQPNNMKDINVQESRSKPYDERFLKLFEHEEYIKEKIKEKIELRKEASLKIDQCKYPIHTTILRLRYLNGLSWDEIAGALNYGGRHVRRIHGSALQDFERENKMS